jgi:hypothetical protein
LAGSLLIISTTLRAAVATWFGPWARAYTATAVATKIATTNFGCMVGSSVAAMMPPDPKITQIKIL